MSVQQIAHDLAAADHVQAMTRLGGGRPERL
jgi:hypothetical protein